MNTMSPRFAQTVIEWRSTAPLLFYLPKECKLTACGESGQLVEHFDFVKNGFIEGLYKSHLQRTEKNLYFF